VERIRSVQGMLQRFRTLFNLPSMIRANISKGEYDLAIREYKKAKSLVLYSHVRFRNSELGVLSWYTT
jgi:exocyst complex component 2